ncbi:MAG: hypothetical protein KKH94_12445, partial [Candidatus Omnitrophica bacterium]|nr:hypothetical protein [Candidatus Omnitrophota bacterium]
IQWGGDESLTFNNAGDTFTFTDDVQMTGDLVVQGNNIDSAAGNDLVINAAAADGVRIGSGTSVSNDYDDAGDLYVTDDAEVSDNLSVGGDIIVAGNNIDGSSDLILNATTTEGVRIGSGTNVSDDFDDTGDLFVTNDIEISGSLSVARDMTIEGAVYTSGSLNVSDDFTVQGRLYVDEIENEADTQIVIKSAVTMESDLTVSGDVTLSGGLSAGGLFVENGSANVGIGTRTPTQALEVVGNAYITGITYVGDTNSYFNTDGNLVLPDNDTIGWGGDETMTFDGSTFTLSDDLQITDDLVVQGNNIDSAAGNDLVINAAAADGVRIGSGTSVSNDYDDAGDLYVTDDLEIGDDLSIAGSLTVVENNINGNPTLILNETMAGGVRVGDGTIVTSGYDGAGDLFVTNDAEIGGDISVGGDIIVTGNNIDGGGDLVLNATTTEGVRIGSGVPGGNYDDAGDLYVTNDLQAGGMVDIGGSLTASDLWLTDGTPIRGGSVFFTFIDDSAGADGQQFRAAGQENSNSDVFTPADAAGRLTVNYNCYVMIMSKVSFESYDNSDTVIELEKNGSAVSQHETSFTPSSTDVFDHLGDMVMWAGSVEKGDYFGINVTTLSGATVNNDDTADRYAGWMIVEKIGAGYDGQANEWRDEGNYITPRDANEDLHIDGNVTINGYLTVSGDLSVGGLFVEQSLNGYVGIGTQKPAYILDAVADSRIGWFGSSTRIKLIPSDFMANDDDGDQDVQYVDSVAAKGVHVSNSNSELYAFVAIPVGYKATHVRVYGNSNDNVIVYSTSITNGTWSASLGNAATGTEINITDVDSDGTNYLVIYIATNSNGDIIYGGYVTIAPI